MFSPRCGTTYWCKVPRCSTKSNPSLWRKFIRNPLPTASSRATCPRGARFVRPLTHYLPFRKYRKIRATTYTYTLQHLTYLLRRVLHARTKIAENLGTFGFSAFRSIFRGNHKNCVFGTFATAASLYTSYITSLHVLAHNAVAHYIPLRTYVLQQLRLHLKSPKCSLRSLFDRFSVKPTKSSKNSKI